MCEFIFKCVVYADIIRYRSIAMRDYRHLSFLIRTYLLVIIIERRPVVLNVVHSSSLWIIIVVLN